METLGVSVLEVTHISNLPTVCIKLMQVVGWVWHYDEVLTHEMSIFVKILFNFKKKILAWIMTNLLKTLLILPKTKNLNWLYHVILKI